MNVTEGVGKDKEGSMRNSRSWAISGTWSVRGQDTGGPPSISQYRLVFLGLILQIKTSRLYPRLSTLLIFTYCILGT